MRMFHIIFWVFIVGMLLWQFSSYNSGLDRKLAATPKRPDHFYYNAQTLAPAVPPKPDAADVKQVSFTTTSESPTAGSFTCHVTLKNVGNLKAINVQIQVAPYLGAILGELDGDGRSSARSLTSNDSVTQITQWVAFPDMAPGETVTKDATFFNQTGYRPGTNYPPVITFESEKK